MAKEDIKKKVMLLVQLVNNIDENLSIFEKAYNKSDKEEFDKSKIAILDSQKKIESLLTKS